MKLFHNIKQYFLLEKKEIKHLLITTVVLGFIFSFTEWGVGEINIQIGLFSMFNASLVVLLSLLVRLAVQKIFAIYRGYKVQYASWPVGLAIAVLIVVILNGEQPFFAVPGVLAFSLIEQLRVGKPRQWKMLSDEALISFAGPFTNLIMAFIFKAIAVSTGNPLASKLVLVNVWFAIISILPIPKLDGFRIFYYSRTWSIFAIIFVIAASVLLQIRTFSYALFAGIAIAAAVTIIYFIRFELGK
jgi:Zn-dependent protease